MKKLFIGLLLLLFTANMFSQSTYICEKVQVCDYEDGESKNCLDYVYTTKITFNEDYDVVSLKTKSAKSTLLFVDERKPVGQSSIFFTGKTENGKYFILIMDFDENTLELTTPKSDGKSFYSQKFFIDDAYKY